MIFLHLLLKISFFFIIISTAKVNLQIPKNHIIINVFKIMCTHIVFNNYNFQAAQAETIMKK